MVAWIWKSGRFLSVFAKFGTIRLTTLHTIQVNSTHYGMPPLLYSTTSDQGCQIHFFKKGQTFSKKGQKQLTKSQTKPKHSIEKGQKRTKPFTWQSQIYKDLPPHNLNFYKSTSCVLIAPPQKAINSKVFLEFVTYDRKMPKFFLFQKCLNKSTWKINSYFSTSLKFWTLRKQSLQLTVTSQNAFK